LVVYPPDISAGARLRVRAWRAWPAAGVLVSAGIALVAASLVGAALGISTAVLVYLGGFVVLAVAAFPERRLVRQVWAEDPGEAAALDDVLGEARVRLLGELLCAADDARADGELSGGEYRDLWRCVYDEVGALLALDPVRVEICGAD
jgi:hypothetical protein